MARRGRPAGPAVKILLTGASSFTGSWFARELVRAGHAVTATFTAHCGAYAGLRAERIEVFAGQCERVYEAPFGGPAFLELLDQGFDVLCHHGACVTDYRSDDFDYVAALAHNAHGIRMVLDRLAAAGLGRVVLTGSVFEADEGAGELPLRAFSPYGLSKGLTASVFRFWCERVGLGLGKFVIPNPFGPYEEPRFTHYLMRTWAKAETAAVKTPAYVRDNIHVSLLARVYADFVGADAAAFHPSGYVETQGGFALRFATAMRDRLGLACGLLLQEQTEFSEPKTRINTDVLDPEGLGWDESGAWDEVADYYRRLLAL